MIDVIRVISSFQGLSLGLADVTNWTLENTSQGHKVMFSWNKMEMVVDPHYYTNCARIKYENRKIFRVPSTSYKYLSLFICLLISLSLDLILKKFSKNIIRILIVYVMLYYSSMLHIRILIVLAFLYSFVL